jgi:hypothetical protein
MPNHKLPQLPWLLQTSVNDDGTNSHSLFNLLEENNYRVDLPQLQGKLLIGSSHGWLVTIPVDQHEIIPSSPEICLINPLTGIQVQLPPRSTFPDVVNYHPDKVGEEYCVNTCWSDMLGNYDTNHVQLNLTNQIVTSSSCAENCVAVVIYGELGELAWCMAGDDKWKPLNLYANSVMKHKPIDDLLFSNNKLYVLNCYGHLFQVENVGPNPKVKKIITQRIKFVNCINRKVVECSDGRIMMVLVKDCDLDIPKFEAYELDLPNNYWRLVNNIGNDMLFLGYNQAFSISSCQYPGYRGNRIYFTDDPFVFIFRGDGGKVGDHDIGIFNFEDGTAEKLPGFPNVNRSLWPQPVWVTPPAYSYS